MLQKLFEQVAGGSTVPDEDTDIIYIYCCIYGSSHLSQLLLFFE